MIRTAVQTGGPCYMKRRHPDESSSEFLQNLTLMLPVWPKGNFDEKQ